MTNIYMILFFIVVGLSAAGAILRFALRLAKTRKGGA
jgi:hypothetical protein